MLILFVMVSLLGVNFFENAVSCAGANNPRRSLRGNLGPVLPPSGENANSLLETIPDSVENINDWSFHERRRPMGTGNEEIRADLAVESDTDMVHRTGNRRGRFFGPLAFLAGLGAGSVAGASSASAYTAAKLLNGAVTIRFGAPPYDYLSSLYDSRPYVPYSYPLFYPIRDWNFFGAPHPMMGPGLAYNAGQGPVTSSESIVNATKNVDNEQPENGIENRSQTPRPVGTVEALVDGDVDIENTLTADASENSIRQSDDFEPREAAQTLDTDVDDASVMRAATFTFGKPTVAPKTTIPPTTSTPHGVSTVPSNVTTTKVPPKVTPTDVPPKVTPTSVPSKVNATTSINNGSNVDPTTATPQNSQTVSFQGYYGGYPQNVAHYILTTEETPLRYYQDNYPDDPYYQLPSEKSIPFNPYYQNYSPYQNSPPEVDRSPDFFRPDRHIYESDGYPSLSGFKPLLQ